MIVFLAVLVLVVATPFATMSFVDWMDDRDLPKSRRAGDEPS